MLFTSPSQQQQQQAPRWQQQRVQMQQQRQSPVWGLPQRSPAAAAAHGNNANDYEVSSSDEEGEDVHTPAQKHNKAAGGCVRCLCLLFPVTGLHVTAWQQPQLSCLGDTRNSQCVIAQHARDRSPCCAFLPPSQSHLSPTTLPLSGCICCCRLGSLTAAPL